MPAVVSFRPTPEEAEAIETYRRAKGLKTRADAVRMLIRDAIDKRPDWKNDPLFRLRLRSGERNRKDITSRDIDRALYGWD